MHSFSTEVTAQLQPELVMTFRGETVRFNCSGSGNIFWHVNDTLLNFVNSDSFAEDGIRTLATYLNEDQSFAGSLVVDTDLVSDSTISFRCTAFDLESAEMNISQKADLVIMGR